MKKFFLLNFFIFFLISQTKALHNKVNATEDFRKNSSVAFLFKNDSLTNQKFDKSVQLVKKEKYVEALEETLKFHNEYYKLGDYYWSYKFSCLLGEIYNKTNKYSTSLKYYNKALSYIYSSQVEKNNSKFSDINFSEAFLNVGTAYHYLSISLEENNKYHYLDSAKSYYNRVVKLPSLNRKVENLQAQAYSNLSGIYEQDSIYEKAEFYVKKAIKINKRNRNDLQTAKSINNLGNIFLSQKKYRESKEIYLEAVNYIEHNNNPDAINVKVDLYFNLAWAMRKLEDYKAYDIQELSYNYLDTIRKKEFRDVIEEINAKHNVGEVQNKRQKDQQAFFIIGFIGLIVILSLAYIINLNKLKQRNLALSLSQNELIKNQEIEKIKSESQTRILNATIDGKESERKQIAQTLHDSVSALLSSAKMHLQATKKQFNGSTPTEIEKTQQILSEASINIRDLSHNLASSVLLNLGLYFAVLDLTEKFSNSELTIETQMSFVRRYDQDFEVKVYHIIQELINNILKHSEASFALIELKEENQQLVLRISDDGVGFDKTTINLKDGLGINQINARIQMMKGKFHIESSQDNGTQISIQVPVIEKEEPNLV